MDERLDGPTLRELLKEMAIHIDQGQDAVVFSNLYLEILRGEQGLWNGDGVDTFSVLLKGNGWNEAVVTLSSYMDPETEEVLRRPEAEAFYKDFRAMVSTALREGDLEDGEEWKRG